MHKRDYESNIGTLDLGGTIGIVTAKIYNYEGGINLAHIHLVNDHFNCAICLHLPKYFIHDGVNDALSNAQMVIFNDFMKSTEEIGRTYITLWDASWDCWHCKEYNNHRCVQPKDMPDYSSIIGSIHTKYKKKKER